MAQELENALEKTRKRLDKCQGQVGHLTVRNLELEQVATRLAVAIENHRLNKSEASLTDRALWDELDRLIEFQ